MARIMVCGPFSALMKAQHDGRYRFSQPLRQRIDSVHLLLEGAGFEILSAHRADAYGEEPWVEDFVRRDLDWAAGCDALLVLLPADPRGEIIRSDGTMIELGFATAHGKPVVLLADDIGSAANSFFVRSFAADRVRACIAWADGFEPELLRRLSEVVDREAARAPRQQRTDVDQTLAELRREDRPHEVTVHGMQLTVLPGVLSPRLSHAPDALISKWTIPPGAQVLDLGCGSGVLGLAALCDGAGHLVALDINPAAVQTTNLNLANLGFSDCGEARLSNTYSALGPDEAFDVIIFAAPYWNRVAADDLDKSCFDHDYAFFNEAIATGHERLRPGGRYYVIFSDQGDVGRALRIIEASALRVQEMHLFRPSQPGGHIRIVWELRRADGATDPFADQGGHKPRSSLPAGRI